MKCNQCGSKYTEDGSCSLCRVDLPQLQEEIDRTVGVIGAYSTVYKDTMRYQAVFEALEEEVHWLINLRKNEYARIFKKHGDKQ